MKIEAIHCPACFAAATILPGADRMTCEYCGTTSFVEQSQGQVTLKFAHELAGLQQALQDSDAQTARSVRSTAEETQKELQSLRLGQELSTVDMRLASVQAELRALQRNTDKKQSKAIKTQVSTLERELGALSAQRARLQNALAALDPVAFDAPSRSVAAASPGRNQSIRGLGCLGWGLLWMTLFLLFGTLLTQVAGEAGPLLSLVLSIAVVVYLQRRRKRKALAA